MRRGVFGVGAGSVDHHWSSRVLSQAEKARKHTTEPPTTTQGHRLVSRRDARFPEVTLLHGSWHCRGERPRPKLAITTPPPMAKSTLETRSNFAPGGGPSACGLDRLYVPFKLAEHSSPPYSARQSLIGSSTCLQIAASL